MKTRKNRSWRLILWFLLYGGLFAQQRPDILFNPAIKDPAYPAGKGPVVLIDSAHDNFHTAYHRYFAFARLLTNDGYIIKNGDTVITGELLASCRIYVSSIPTSKQGRSAFSAAEIKLVHEWVKKGGALLLITDHAPDPPAIAELAAAFGIKVHNGWVLNMTPDKFPEEPMIFRRSAKHLGEHPITNGRNPAEMINAVASFTGCAFQAGKEFSPLLIIPDGKSSWMPVEEGLFESDTPRIQVGGWYQGAAAEYGRGRIAFFGEAAMFTAQRFGRAGNPVGMNRPEAQENPQFLLNVLHWLSGII